jgi:FAD/FMN-containing dehydrogenase
MTITRPATSPATSQQTADTKGVTMPTAVTTAQSVTAQPDLARLRGRLTGELITADHPEFDEARKVHDITVDRRPCAIVRAACAEDVAEAVRFARQHNLPLAVRSGGHSVSHVSMIEDAVVADLSALKGVTIDPEKRIAHVQPGATSGDLAPAAHAYGLALSTGDTSSVGMGGLTTGGGIGYMVRKYGLAIDNLLSAQVVTADGQIVTASVDEHPDLFWAIRGGGGNFGIITQFVFRLAPVGQVLGGALILPATKEVIRGYLEYSVKAPEDLTTMGDLMQAPQAPFIPEDRVGEPILMILTVWTGDIEDGERALAPLRALAEPVADTIAPMPYPAIYEYSEEVAAPHAAAVRSMFADDISDATIEALLEAVSNGSPMDIVQLRGLGGAMASVGANETAFGNRDKPYLVLIVSCWFDPAEDARPHHDWTESLWDKVRSDGSGVYVNFLENEGEDRIREAYGNANFARLAEIKAKYDPTNLFRFNQNIRPAAS